MATNLANIKAALGITGTYQDATIQEYINEVTAFLVDAGVPATKITDGIIARGVADLWNYGGGAGALSPYFLIRASQLGLKG